MTTPVSVLASGVLNATAAPATAKITANTRVTAAAGPIGILTDVMQFSGPTVVGNWIVGATRVLVNAVPVINQAASGTSIGPPPTFTPSGPMTVAQGDPRIKAT